MSIQFAETPDSQYANQKGHGKRIEVQQWADYHGIYRWLMPLDSRERNPIEIIRQVKKGLDDLRDTTWTFRQRMMGWDQLSWMHTNNILPLFRITHYQHNSSRRYRNPNYTHYKEAVTPIKDYTERVKFYKQVKDSPTVDVEFVATHFGNSETRVRNWVRNSEFPNVGEQRQQNRKRLARSLYTIYAWGVESQAELKRLMPIDDGTVDRWLQRFVRDADWMPPKHPDAKQWFNP